MSDIFQEVEEDVRRERYEQLWKKYGNHVIGAAAVLVIAVGGWQAWTAYDNNQRRAVSDQYEARCGEFVLKGAIRRYCVSSRFGNHPRS
jgi:hypothetical protein